MTAVFMHGDDVEWTLLDGDGEVAQVGETTTTEETTAEQQQQQHVEELRAALDRKEAELMRTRRIAGRADRHRTRRHASSASPRARRPTTTTLIRDGLWYASFPPEGASVSDAPVMVAVCVGCGYAKPAELLGVSFHEGIPHSIVSLGSQRDSRDSSVRSCDTRRTAHAEGKLDQLIDMGFDRDARELSCAARAVTWRSAPPALLA